MAKTTKAPTSEKVLVDCFIPDDEFAARGGAHQTFVSVNGKNYLCKTGEMIKVPPEVKEVIDNSLEAKKAALNRAESASYADPTPANM